MTQMQTIGLILCYNTFKILTENVYQRYLAARTLNTQGEDCDRWGVYESSIADYEETFASVGLTTALTSLKEVPDSQTTMH